MYKNLKAKENEYKLLNLKSVSTTMNSEDERYVFEYV